MSERSDLFCVTFLEHKKNRWKFQIDRVLAMQYIKY